MSAKAVANSLFFFSSVLHAAGCPLVKSLCCSILRLPCCFLGLDFIWMQIQKEQEGNLLLGSPGRWSANGWAE